MSSDGALEKNSGRLSRRSSADASRSSPPPPPVSAPFSAQFLDSTDAATKARRIYVKILVQRTALICVAIFAIFSIYWGALWKIPARQLEGWIVDFDGDRIGQDVANQLVTMSGPEIKWSIHSASEFPGGVNELSAGVLEEICWVAIAINAGATQRLTDAFSTANPAYNGSTAITAFAVEARNENAFRALTRPAIDLALQKVTHAISVAFISELWAQKNGTALLQVSPNTVVQPVFYTLVNLRPFDVPVATAVTFVGLIYLLILSFFVMNSGIMARAASGLERNLTLGSLIRIRVVSPILIYLVISFFYSLVTLAFKLPFDRKFGHSGFPVFWMLSWFGMMAAGLALETMYNILTIKYIQIFLILWIISNVSVCLWPIDALPRLYEYGHAAPFYQISRGVRTIVFSTKNEVGLNFGILAVWIAISCITLPLVQFWRRREEVRTWRRQQEGKSL